MRRVFHLAADTVVLLVAVSVIAGWLLRTAPGGAVDVREADPRYSRETVARLKAERDAARSGLGRSAEWFAAAVRGDFGRSETSGAPVAEMIAERVPVTVKTVIAGAAGGFALALSAAALGLWAAAPRWIASSGFLGVLALPSGLIALFAVFLRLPVEVAVAIAVAPRTYFYAAELLETRTRSEWLLAARAAGLPHRRIFFRHVLPSARGEMAAIAGLAVVNALAVTIPAEALTGRPGIGQLAWQSAMERDLPVVLVVTLVMLIVARAVTLLSSLPPRQAGAAV